MKNVRQMFSICFALARVVSCVRRLQQRFVKTRVSLMTQLCADRCLMARTPWLRSCPPLNGVPARTPPSQRPRQESFW